jgi:hypothetical protein
VAIHLIGRKPADIAVEWAEVSAQKKLQLMIGFQK